MMQATVLLTQVPSNLHILCLMSKEAGINEIHIVAIFLAFPGMPERISLMDLHMFWYARNYKRKLAEITSSKCS